MPMLWSCGGTTSRKKLIEDGNLKPLIAASFANRESFTFHKTIPHFQTRTAVALI
jgi:hypothetical protein